MIENILIFTVASLGFYLFIQYRKKFNYFKDRGIPYLKGYPIVGSMGRVFLKMESIFSFMLRSCEEHKSMPLFGLFGMSGPTYMIQDLEMIKQITTTHAENFINRPDSFSSEHEADSILTKSLLGLRDDKWKKMRSVVSPSFTSSKMKILYELVKETTEDLVSYLKENLKNDGVIEIEARDIAAKAAANAITTSALGLKIDSLRDKDNTVFKSAMKLAISGFNFNNLLIMLLPKLAKYLDLSLFDKTSSTLFKNLINDAVAEREQKNIYRPDVIQLLMKEKDKITNTELTAQAFVFILGGLEPVSQGLQHSFYELAINEDCQEKLYQEIQQMRAKLAGKPITFEDLNEMEYLEAFFNEVLRKKLSLFLERKCNADTILTDSNGQKHKIEAGTTVMIPSHVIHHTQKYYPNPERFDPDRFLGEKKKEYGIANLPFGNGQRNCIGMRFAQMETKLVLYSILSEFIVQPSEKTLIPFQWGLGFTNLPAKPIILELKKRAN